MANRNHLRILVVDDEPGIADTLSLIRKSSGYETATCYNGETASEVMPAFSPDVLISDVVMPGMSGIALANLVRNLKPECRILLISGQANTLDFRGQAAAHDKKLTFEESRYIPR